MPHLDYSFDIDMERDGATGGQRYLIDLSKELSALYGRLIRQGQTFKVNSIQVSVESPDGTFETANRAMGVAGDIYYLHPTANRKKAWMNGLSAVNRLRRLLGIVSKGYDFRVGLRGNTGWNTVDNQAWVRNEDEPLCLGYNADAQNSLFSVYNDRLVDASLPVDPDLLGFGAPFDFPGLGTGDADFTANDATYFSEGYASLDMAGVRFQTSFSGAYDDAGAGGDWGAMTNSEVIDGPIWAMCGLLGIDVDTTYVDRSEAQTQNCIMHVTVDVESWTPFVKRGKRGRRSRR